MSRFLGIWKLLFSVLILAILWRLIDFSLIATYVLNPNWSVLAIIILLIPVSIGIRAYRFHYIINGKKKLLRFRDALRITLVGETLNIILPASTGDFAKVYFGYKKHQIKEEMITAALIDKIAGLIGLFIMGTIAAVIHGYNLLALFFCSGFVVLMIFTFIPRLIPWLLLNKLLIRIKRSIVDVPKLRRSFATSNMLKVNAILISIAAWTASFALLYAITQLFNLDISILFLLSVAPLITLSRLFPFAWGGLGVQEGVTTYLFSLAGISPSVSIVTSLIFTLTATVIPGLIGLIHLLSLKKGVLRPSEKT